MGASGSTSSLVSENAHVVTAEAPPPGHDDATTHTGRYQAVADGASYPKGTLNRAFSVGMSLESTFQNMNSYTVPSVPDGVEGW
jgi:hypothetical protein